MRFDNKVVVVTAGASGMGAATARLLAREGAAYVSSKFGGVSTTLTVASEFAPHGIRVNGVAPGSIDTPMLAMLPQQTREAFAATLPSRRLGTAEEVASVIAFLRSDDASSV